MKLVNGRTEETGRRALTHNTAAAQYNRPFFQLAPQHSSQLSPSRYSPAVHPAPSPSLPFLTWGWGGGLKMNSGQACGVPGVISWKPGKIAQKMEEWSPGREAEGGGGKEVRNKEKVVVMVGWRGGGGKRAHTRIHHDHRHTTHRSQSMLHTNLPEPSQKYPPASVSCASACICLFPHPRLFQSDPGSRGVVPREELDVTELPPRRHAAPTADPPTLFHGNIQAGRSERAEFCSPSSRRNRPWIIQLSGGEC